MPKAHTAASLLVLLAVAGSSRAEVKVRKNVMMAARDGVKLATDVYLPARNGRELAGPFPAVLVRTPYGKNGFAGRGKKFAERGYAVVVQDVRGRHESKGTFYIYVNEGKDGYDAVEWVAAQKWCNGDVGTWGPSYLAATQNATAVERPPHLKTMFVIVGTSNYIEDGAGRGGAFALLHNMVYCFALARKGHEAGRDPVTARALNGAYDRLADLLWAHPLKRTSPLRAATSYQKWYFDWRDHPTYDSYWKRNGYNFEEHFDRYPAIPICFMGGWYDIFKRGTIRCFRGLAEKHPQTRLIMGPWVHGVGGTLAGDVDFGAAARRSVDELSLRWFDRHLHGIKNGSSKDPRVRYFLMGGGEGRKNKAGHLQSGGEWQSATTWPPADSQPRKYYLHGDGRLLFAAPAAKGVRRFEFDPRDPVPTLGGNIDSGRHLVPRGAQNQTPPKSYFAARNTLPLSSRPDVLTFESEVLKEPLVIAGQVRVKLWVASTATDTDFTAKLIDVYPPSPDYPDGYAMNLEDGILRMRFRRSREREEPMKPGTVYPVTIDLWSTANRFLPGHRVRLDISSSNFPMYDINPNTGEFLGRHTHRKTALNSVFFGPRRPSHIVLPVRRSPRGP